MHDADFYRSLIDKTPTGYAYCRVLYDSVGNPEDLSFLDVNAAFYKLNRIYDADIVNRSFKEVFKDRPIDPAFINAVNLVALEGRGTSLTTYFSYTDCCFKLDLFSPLPGYLVIQVSDVTEVADAKKKERNLQKRLHHEQLLFQVSRLAMQDLDIDTFLDDCMPMIGKTLDFSRVYIFHHDHVANTIDNTHEWVATGISPQKENLQGLPGDSLPWWTEILESNQNIVYHDIEDIPDEFTKSILRPQGIKSLLVVPLFVDNQYYGFMGFDECSLYRDWTGDDVQLLQSVVFLISNSIKQKRDQQILQGERAQLLSLFESIHEPIYVSDMNDYRILYCNQAMQRVFGPNMVGQLCYEFLMKRSEPCDFCTNSIIQALEYQPYEWENYNPIVNRHYQIVDRMIRWPDGRNVRFEMAIDITNYRRATRELQTEKERLNVTLHSIGDGVVSTDQQGTVLMMNGVAENLTGWWREEALGKPLSKVLRIFLQSNGEPCPDPVNQALSLPPRRNTVPSHAMLLSRNGLERPIEYTASPIKDASGEVLGVVLVFRDVTQQKKEEEEILYLSYHDRLTGLYNRTFFERELTRLDTQRQLPLSLIMGDVNGLKITNDVFGHQEGDRLLQSIAQLLRDSCRTEDIIARWGGDEFVILLPQTTHEYAHAICERIDQACRESNQNLTPVSISLGYATKEKASDAIMQILRQAEDFMYKRKLLESKSTRSSIVASITQTLFEKNLESEEHTRRLSSLSRCIGLKMGLQDHQLNELELLAMLHDIGKIAINDAILHHAGPLSDDEVQEMQRHPEIGYRIAQSVPDLAPISEYILSHHEWWDGNGYPQGLAGEMIPLPARILAVVDAYDALLDTRPYREPLSDTEARAELAKGSGTQFDPDIVRIFLEEVVT